MPKKLPSWKRLLFSVTAIVIGFSLLEGGLYLVHFITHPRKVDIVTKRTSMSMYRGKDWAAQYWAEALRTNTVYQPFYGWARTEYKSHYTNVDSNGSRRTWNPTDSLGLELDTLYMFGGSTLWGSGARDDHTIPSELSRILHERGYSIHIRNYGETGYTFTQELIRLILLLRDGHRPNYVIFYDGVNDVYSAYQSGMTGSVMNVSDTRNRLRRKTDWELAKIGLYGLLQEYCMTYRAAAKLVSILNKNHLPDQKEVASQYDNEKLFQLAAENGNSYSQTTLLLDKISEAYGFDYLCFWQPVAFTEEFLTDEESQSDPRLKDATLEKFYRYNLDVQQDKFSTKFFNIADALYERSVSCYIDFCHLSEKGNRMVAERISGIMVEELSLVESLVVESKSAN